MNELISGVRADVAIKVNGDDLDTLNRLAARVADIVRDVPGAADVRVEETTGLPMLVVNPDRQALSRYGLNPRDVQRTVSTAVGGTVAGQFIEGDRRADIVVRLPEQLRQSPEWLADLPIPRAGRGNEDEVSRGANWAGGEPQFVPLREVANIEESTGPNQVNRENGKRRVVVTANVRGPRPRWFRRGSSRAPGCRPACAAGLLDRIRRDFRAAGLRRAAIERRRARGARHHPGAAVFCIRLDARWSRDFQRRTACAHRRSRRVVAARYSAVDIRGCWIHCLVGRGRIERSRHGRPDPHARAERADDRRGDRQRRDGATRAVLVTALVASLGFLPMALNVGPGAEVQRPLATVVIGGIVSSTLLTLLVLPGLYRLLSRHK